MNINIIGAGMAGLLAGQMLTRMPGNEVTIYEKQPSLPNNHSAVLRFRSAIVGDVLGIPFKKVTMVKCSVPWRNPIADALAYTNKCTGYMRSDRSLPTESTTEERYIAPSNLIQRMSEGLNIKYESEIEGSSLKLNGQLNASVPVISTMPMHVLMSILGYECNVPQAFVGVSGYNIRAAIDDCDAYVSLYIPNPFVKFSRISISGNQLIIEMQESLGSIDVGKNGSKEYQRQIVKDYVNQACSYLGININKVGEAVLSKQKYAKILPINDEVRKDFMYWATDKFNIYSLGRYATWRPKLLLDDLVNDVRKIAGWAARNDRYAAARSR